MSEAHREETVLSSSKKRYLLTICELGKTEHEIYSKDIASSLGIKRPSASKMLGMLAEEGLIEKKYYGTVRFTPQGASIADALYRDYLLLYGFFTQLLRIPAEDAKKDAVTCLCELSPVSLSRMTQLVCNSREG